MSIPDDLVITTRETHENAHPLRGKSLFVVTRLGTAKEEPNGKTHIHAHFHGRDPKQGPGPALIHGETNTITRNTEANTRGIQVRWARIKGI